MAFKLIKENRVEVFSDYYQEVNTVHSYPTSRANKLSTEFQFKGSYGYGTFHYKSIQLWNNLGDQLRNVRNYETFKRDLKLFLINKQKLEIGE